jgi:branched-chain amino acid transport system permease protein
MNLRVAKFGKFRRMRLPYVAVIAAGVPLFIGITSLIEMIYHYQLESANGTTTSLWGLTVDTATPIAWIAAAVLLAIGCLLMRYASRFFKRAWSSAQTEIQALLERSIA